MSERICPRTSNNCLDFSVLFHSLWVLLLKPFGGDSFERGAGGLKLIVALTRDTFKKSPLITSWKRSWVEVFMKTPQRWCTSRSPHLTVITPDKFASVTLTSLSWQTDTHTDTLTGPRTLPLLLMREVMIKGEEMQQKPLEQSRYLCRSIN